MNVMLSILKHVPGFLTKFFYPVCGFFRIFSGFKSFSRFLVMLSSFGSCFWNLFVFLFFRILSGFSRIFPDFISGEKARNSNPVKNRVLVNCSYIFFTLDELIISSLSPGFDMFDQKYCTD